MLTRAIHLALAFTCLCHSVEPSVPLENRHDSVATNQFSHICSSYTTCTPCVSNSSSCKWCVENHRCTHDVSQDCRHDLIITANDHIGPSIRSGPDFCPRIITSNAAESTEILIPGSTRRIHVNVHHLPVSAISTHLICQFLIEGQVHTVSAQLLGDTIYCEPMQFSHDTPVMNVPLSVLWSGNKPLDNPQNIHVSVYNCELMAFDCHACLELPEKYRCGWCQGTCEVQHQCSNSSRLWLNRRQTCPTTPYTNPFHISIKPNKGPKSGGSKIEIFGIPEPSDGHTEVLFGTHRCHVTRHLPNVTECITSATINEGTAIVRAKLDHVWHNFDNITFHYLDDPEITEVQTGRYGPIGIAKGTPSGGVTVNFKGTNLDSVQAPVMFITLNGVHYNSTCTAESPTHLKCLSPVVDSSAVRFEDDHVFHLELDYGLLMDGVHSLMNLSSHPGFSKFQLFRDPVFYPFEEEDQIKHFRGDYLTFHGANIDPVYEGEDMSVRIGTASCTVTSTSYRQLTCRAPASLPAAQEGSTDPSEIPEVWVEVGPNLKFRIGRLRDDRSSEPQDEAIVQGN